MLKRLLHDTDAVQALSDKLGLFRDPQQLEQYVVASEVAVEVMNLFFTRVLGPGTVSADASADLGAVREFLGACFLNERKEGVYEHSVVERLERKVSALERRLEETQKQLRRLDKSYTSDDDSDDEQKTEETGKTHHDGHIKEEVSEKWRSDQVVRLKDCERGSRQSEAKESLMKGEEIEKLRKIGEFVFNGENPLEGIIAHLSQECGGNVDEEGVVAITSSEFYDGDEPRTVADLGTDPWFGSLDNPNSWICYDFKEKRVVLTSYSVRTHVGPSFPRSWVLEASNDGTEGSWLVVDRREDNNELHAPYVTHNFACASSASQGMFRFVRLRQTGKNHNGGDELYLTSLEVFGTLYGQ